MDIQKHDGIGAGDGANNADANRAGASPAPTTQRDSPRKSAYSRGEAGPRRDALPTGIILAGGHSTRMGCDKALLPLPDSPHNTFVAHLVALLTRQCSTVVLVARDAAQATHYAHLAASIVIDATPNIGPLMGIYTGLQAIHTSHALVTAVDMPFIEPALVTFLLTQPLDDHLLVPMVNSIPQVLLAVYPRATLSIIKERLQAGRRDPRSLLTIAPTRFLDEEQLRAIDPSLRSFVNINTPEEYNIPRL